MKRLLTPYLRRIGLRLGFERDWYLYIVAAIIGHERAWNGCFDSAGRVGCGH